MTAVRIYDNRHIQDQAKTIMPGQTIVLVDSFSRKRWSLFFRYYGIDEAGLDITYITVEEYHKLKEKKEISELIGNPPYVDGSNGESNIYHRFVDFSADHIAMVLPTSWFLSDQTPHSQLRKGFFEHGLKHISIHPMDAFNNASVRTATIVSEKGYRGTVRIDHYDGYSFDIDPKNTNHKILITPCPKFTDTLFRFQSMPKYRSKQGKSPVTHKKPTTMNASLCPTRTHKYPTITKLSKTHHEYSYTDVVLDDDIDSYRVAYCYITSGYDKGKTSLGVVSVIKPGTQLAVSYRYIVCDSEEEAQSIAFYLQSKLAQAVLYHTRTSRTVDNPQLSFLPKLDKYCHTDTDIYDYFNLSHEEIDYIESLGRE